MLQGIIGGDIALTTKLDPALWCTRIDRSQIEQIIVNLAVNAGAAMPEGGTLLFSTRNHVESGTGHSGVPPGHYVELEVTDSGEGIDPDVMPHLFEPFFTTRPRGEGTGLGLASVYGIVEQAGGSIEATSEVGAGATFRILLPASDETDA